MSWTNMMLDLASIPANESDNKIGDEGEELEYVDPENEQEELRKSLRL